MTVLIFVNGEIEDVEWIRPYLQNDPVVIAANGGTGHLLRLAHVPNFVIGDLDSLPTTVRERFAAATFLSYPAEKDETDLELALAYAVGHYEGDIYLFGMLGGRLDQQLANIFLLTHRAWVTRQIKVVEPHQQAWVVAAVGSGMAETYIEGEIGDTVSLLPLGGDVVVASSEGLKWELHEEVLALGPARGVSNVMMAKTAVVRVRSGTLLCVHTILRLDKLFYLSNNIH